MTAVNALVYHRGETVLRAGLGAAGARQHGRHARVPGRRRRDRAADRGRRDARLRRLLGLRRPRPGAARAASRRPALGADRRARRPAWCRSRRPTRPGCARPRPCAAPAPSPVGRAALARRLVEGSLDRAVDVAATLELRGHSLDRPGCGRARAANGDRPRRWSPRPLCSRPRRSPALARRRRRLRDLSADRDGDRAGDAGAVRGAAAARLAAVRAQGLGRRGAPVPDPPTRPGGRPCLTPSCAARASPTATRRREADALRDVDLRIEPGRAGRPLRALGLGQDHPAARGLRPRAALPRRRGRRASSRSAGMDVREHGPAELAAAVGLVAQEPETQVVSTTVGAEIELPLELRGVPPEPRARAVEEVALALGDRRPAGADDRHALRRRAAAGGARRRPGHPARAGAARRAHLAARPRRGRRADRLLRRLNEEWGVAILLGEHRLERCLGAADRVIAMDRGAIAFDGGAERLPRLGADARRPALATPGARLFSRPACRRPRACARRASDAGAGAAWSSRGPARSARTPRSRPRRPRRATSVLRARSPLGRAGRGRRAHRRAARAGADRATPASGWR